MQGEIIHLSSMYDLLYKRASLAMKILDPCRIKAGTCLRGDFCCRDCFHLGRNGCTVEALACKVWLCRKASRTPGNETCRRILQTLAEIAEDLKISGYRYSKQENLFAAERVVVDAEWMNRCREKLRSCERLIYLLLPPKLAGQREVFMPGPGMSH